MIDVQAKRRDKHESAGKDGVGGDQHHESKNGDARPKQRHDARGDAYNPVEHKKTPALVPPRCPDSARDCKGSVDKGISDEDGDQ